MATHVDFDKSYWGKIIQSPDWYLKFVPYMQDMQKELEKNPEEGTKFIKTVRYFFEEALENDLVNLATEGPNLDEERQPIDTVVIHHTSSQPRYPLSYMNAVQLLNIYAPYYTDPTIRNERGLAGKPIWSGHFLNGKPSFIGYHWLMRMDGNFERILMDEELGWHAGNWEINKRSVGICLDNDYDHQEPSNDLLEKLAGHIKQNYNFVRFDKIIGHCEAREGTTCPGKNFLTGWKNNLLQFLEEAK
jgi:hypothetical protein